MDHHTRRRGTLSCLPPVLCQGLRRATSKRGAERRLLCFRMAVPLWASCLFIMVLFGAVDPTLANPFDIFGFGSRGQAMGSALGAAADGVSATYYNPAALTCARDVRLEVGYTHLFSNLSIDGRFFEMDDMVYSSLVGGLSIPWRLGRITGGLGVGINLPDQGTIRTRLLRPVQPRFVLINNRMQRAELLPAVAVEVLPGLSIGVGLSILAVLTGEGLHIETELLNATTDAEVDIEIQGQGGLNAGLLWRLPLGLRFGVTYRSDVDFEMEILEVADFSLASDISFLERLGLSIALSQEQDIHYSPKQVVAALAWNLGRHLLVATDLTWSDWSSFATAGLNIGLETSGSLAELLVLPPPFPTDMIDPGFKDTWTPRFGIELQVHDDEPLAIFLRGGYVYEPSPVPEQTGLFNHLDNDKQIFCFGLGLAWRDPWGILTKPLDLDLHMQYFHFMKRQHTKEDPTDPHGDIESHGSRIHVGGMVVFRF